VLVLEAGGGLTEPGDRGEVGERDADEVQDDEGRRVRAVPGRQPPVAEPRGTGDPVAPVGRGEDLEGLPETRLAQSSPARLWRRWLEARRHRRCVLPRRAGTHVTEPTSHAAV